MKKLERIKKLFLKKIKKNKEKILLVFIFLLGLFLRIYKLEEIPGELWGDVNEHIIYAKQILKGSFYWRFFGGDGPVFDYLTALFFLIFGKNFFAIKLTTVFIGLLILYFSYLVLKKIEKEKLVIYFTLFLMSSSFWLISFSRQAKPYILVLLFIQIFVYLYLNKKYFLSGFILGLGLFTQSSFWGMSVFSILHWKIFFSFLPFFILLFFNQIYPEILSSPTSYLGEKIGHQLSLSEKIYNFFENIFDNFQSILFKGDIVFRHNIPGRPILDYFLAVFFIIGFFIFLRNILFDLKKRRISLFLFLIFIFSQFSSFLDIANPQNSPSFGRIIGTAFFIYYVCSLGIFYFYDKLIFNFKKNFLPKLFLFFLLFFVFLKNFYDYFFIYPKTLPNNNTAYGKIISDDIKKEFKFNKKTKIIIYGCCWGEWGQPEPKSFSNYLEDKIDFNYFDFFEEKKFCNFIKNKKEKLLIYTINNIKIDCLESLKVKNIDKNFYQKIFVN